MKKLVDLHRKDVDREGLTPVFLKTQAGGVTRAETWNGRSYFVAQTVAVISKVLNGELLPADEVSMFTEAWNGRPVPLRHPQVNGLFVSANSPQVLEEFNIGFFFNARSEPHPLGARLVGEIWLDEQIIEQKGGAALDGLNTLRQGGQVEVSTAYFCLVSDESGEFNGEPYSGVQYNVKPDHVAFLPDQEGACSVKDGCGVNVNASQDRTKGQEDTAKVNVLAPGQSAMIGVFLTPEVASILQMEDQAAPYLRAENDLHVTLAYLGEGEQVTATQNELSELVDYISRQLYAHTVQITGSFRFFNADRGQDAVGYLVDGESLANTRRIIVSELNWMGQNVSRPEQWIPHITLGYTPDQDFTVPSPGVERFGVQAISLVYGNESIRFPLRGELGSSYVTMEKNIMTQKQQNLKANCGQDLKAQDAGDAEDQAQAPVDGGETVITMEVPAELQSFMDEVQAAGGVQAIMDALQTVTAANSARRNGLEERIKAMTSVFTDEDLSGMTVAQLEKTADALGATTAQKVNQARQANYAAASGGTQAPKSNTVQVDGIGELRPYNFED